MAAHTLFPRASHSAEVTFRTEDVFGVKCRIISIPMSGKEYRLNVEVARGFPGTDEEFPEYIKRTNPIAAINGTFFGKNNLIPVGDIVKDGKLIHFGGIGTALALTKNNEVRFIDVERWQHMDWTPYLTVLAAGPRLVTNGKVTVDPKGQGFSDPHVLGKANRIAIGLTTAGDLLLVGVRSAISLEECAAIMIKLGCTQAMNSDGGASQAMYFRGQYVITAGRKLTNVLYVVPYEKAPEGFGGISGGAGESKSAEQYFDKGKEAMASGKWADAVEAFKLATSIDPNQAAFYNSLAEAYGKLGKRREQAIAHRQAGKIYLSKGMYDVALKKLAEALKLSGEDPETYRNMGLAYEGLGDTDHAVKMYKLAEMSAFSQSGTVNPKDVKKKGPDSAGEGPAAAEAAPPAELEAEALPLVEPAGPGFDGTVSGQIFRERNIGFSLSWPEGWEAKVEQEKMVILLSHKEMPFYGTVQVFEADDADTLEEFESMYVGGTYKTEIRRYSTEVDGAPALRTLYEEIVNGRSCGEQYFYVKKGRWMIVMSFMTYAEHYAEGGPDFAQIVKGLTLNGAE
ncbi:MAG: phosphodiester glycosidase family protein [bacterium]